MKTLQKLALIAVAVFSAGAANAQECVNCTPPEITTPEGGSQPECRDCDRGQNSGQNRYANASDSRGSSRQTSYVLQRGDNQFACVDQIGNDNQADLIQSSDGVGRNDAYQTQKNLFSLDDNVAYGRQTGDRNLLVQDQNGGDNLASAVQSGDRNVAGQLQRGDGNSAYMVQRSDRNFAVQIQRGDDNVASTLQNNIDSQWSATVQRGDNNTVSVHQH